MLAAGEAKRTAERESPWQLRYLGDPVLTTPCAKVTDPDEIPAGLLDAMREVCAGRRRALPDNRKGLGLGANQVGALVRVCLVQIAGDHELQTLINPRIVERSVETAWGPEGCLSIPGFQTNTERHRTIVVSYRDAQFFPKQLSLSGLSARVVQHELEHLDGTLFIDGLSRQLRRQAERAVEKARR